MLFTFTERTKMRTKIFSHRGYIGIESNVSAEGLLNNPKEKGQLGLVINAKYIDISVTALEILKKIRKGHDGLGEIDVYKANDGTIVFSMLGGPLKIVNPRTCETSRDYDPSLLVTCDNVDIPDGFIDYIDNSITNGDLKELT